MGAMLYILHFTFDVYIYAKRIIILPLSCLCPYCMFLTRVEQADLLVQIGVTVW